VSSPHSTAGYHMSSKCMVASRAGWHACVCDPLAMHGARAWPCARTCKQTACCVRPLPMHRAPGYYLDPSGQEHGPVAPSKIRNWVRKGHFVESVQVRSPTGGSRAGRGGLRGESAEGRARCHAGALLSSASNSCCNCRMWVRHPPCLHRPASLRVASNASSRRLFSLQPFGRPPHQQHPTPPNCIAPPGPLPDALDACRPCGGCHGRGGGPAASSAGRLAGRRPPH
jgi:hypothetical protein